MKQFTTFLNKFVFTLAIIILLLMTYNSVSFTLTIEKRKNSLLTSVGEIVDGSISTYNLITRK